MSGRDFDLYLRQNDPVYVTTDNTSPTDWETKMIEAVQNRNQHPERTAQVVARYHEEKRRLAIEKSETPSPPPTSETSPRVPEVVIKDGFEGGNLPSGGLMPRPGPFRHLIGRLVKPVHNQGEIRVVVQVEQVIALFDRSLATAAVDPNQQSHPAPEGPQWEEVWMKVDQDDAGLAVVVIPKSHIRSINLAHGVWAHQIVPNNNIIHVNLPGVLGPPQMAKEPQGHGEPASSLVGYQSTESEDLGEP